MRLAVAADSTSALAKKGQAALAAGGVGARGGGTKRGGQPRQRIDHERAQAGNASQVPSGSGGPAPLPTALARQQGSGRRCPTPTPPPTRHRSTKLKSSAGVTAATHSPLPHHLPQPVRSGQRKHPHTRPVGNAVHRPRATRTVWPPLPPVAGPLARRARPARRRRHPHRRGPRPAARAPWGAPSARPY